MRKKLTFFTLFMFAFVFGLFAKDVNKATAEKVAVNFFWQKSNLYGDKVNYYDLNIIDAYKVADAYYVINFEDGWVLVSADDALVPVLGYNLSGNFPTPDKLDYNSKSYIQTYVDEVNYVRENNIQADDYTNSVWEMYTTSNPESLNIKDGKDVPSLLDPIAWNQDYPWNVLCPEDPAGPGGHVYVGCVATAMSQLMVYWRYPLKGQGQKSYYLPGYGTISANFDTTYYHWEGMKTSMDTRNVHDMALLGFHAGVSVKMNYSPEGSGSQSSRVPNALKAYFKYANTVKFISKENYSNSYWESKLQSEINVGRPVYYSGYSSDGGHAFNCDGYQTGTPNYYHFNFGWGGSANGYYTLNDVGGFNSGQGMVHGVKPGDPEYPYIATGIDTLTRMAGSFTDGSGPVENYPAGMNAQWLISPQTEHDSVSSIKIHFVKMKTYPNDDIITIYDGPTTNDPIIGSWSGTDMPADFTVNNNQVLVTFTSSHSYPGFMIEYSTTGATWCSGTQEITDPYGTVTDGSVNGFYYNNGTTCTYYLHHPEAVKYNFEFTEFETEPDKDKLTFYTEDGGLIDTFSGFEIPDPFSVEAKGIVIFWETNASDNYQGWSFDFTVDGVGVKESHFDQFSIYPNPAHETLNINFSMEKANNVEVILTNLKGQKVYYEQMNTLNGNYNRSIDVSQLPKGVYLLSIISNKGKTNKKVIIQ